MRRTADQQVSWIDELVQLFESKKSGQKIWFSRKMNKLLPEQQDEVWAFLEGRGHKRPKPKKKKETTPEKQEEQESGRTFIAWTDEEWDQLAEMVWRARKNDPSETLVGLVRKVSDIFPKERRRNIRTANELKQLIERLRQRDENLCVSNDDLEFYKLQISEYEAKHQQIPSREQILSALSDEEVVLRFGETVLQNSSLHDIITRYPTDAILSSVPATDAIGYFLKMGIEMFADSQNQLLNAVRELTSVVRQQQVAVQHPKPTTHQPGKQPMPTPRVKSRVPKVTVVGLLANQQAKVEEALKGRANFNFVDKNRKPDSTAIPDGQDFVVLAANFITHSMQEAAKKKLKGSDTKLIVHHGGIETMVRKLEAALPAAELALV